MSRWSLDNRTALVTGAAKRIGRSTALALARDGCDVVVHYGNSRDEAMSAVAEIEGIGRRAWAVGADLSDRAALDGLFAQATSACGGPIDVLVNSASIFPEDTYETVSFDDLEKNMLVNAWAPFALTRELARQGREGAVVNLLDTRIVGRYSKHVAYLESKRMLHTLTVAAAVEYAPQVRVSGVAPGLILPPPGKDESYIQGLAAKANPMGVHGDVGDVVDAVLYLLRSPFVTGQVIYVDGGEHARERPHG